MPVCGWTTAYCEDAGKVKHTVLCRGIFSLDRDFEQRLMFNAEWQDNFAACTACYSCFAGQSVVLVAFGADSFNELGCIFLPAVVELLVSASCK